MTIFTTGYAVNGMDAKGAIKTLVSLRPKRENWRPVLLNDDIPPKEWAGRLLEVKGLKEGVYLKCDYRFTDGFLCSVSKRVGAVLHIAYYENMGGYGCSYFVDGQKLLSRVTVSTGNTQDEHLTNEFNGIHTKEIIEKLFAVLTGEGLTVAVMEKQKKVYYIKTR